MPDTVKKIVSKTNEKRASAAVAEFKQNANEACAKAAAAHARAVKKDGDDKVELSQTSRETLDYTPDDGALVQLRKNVKNGMLRSYNTFIRQIAHGLTGDKNGLQYLKFSEEKITFFGGTPEDDFFAKFEQLVDDITAKINAGATSACKLNCVRATEKYIDLVTGYIDKKRQQMLGGARECVSRTTEAAVENFTGKMKEKVVEAAKNAVNKAVQEEVAVVETVISSLVTGKGKSR